jgi:glycosyltransferase involved in cell wall biosynthesis
VRVLILPRHTRQAASCRHRFLQYIPYLQRQGVECGVAPFFDTKYTSAVLRGRKQMWRTGQALLTRVATLLRARQYDLVVVHVELVPYLPHAFERLLAALAVPFVVDFDDAIFHAYDQHRSWLVRRLFGTKLGRLMASAELNCAGSEYLASYARRFSDRVALVPTVVDLARYPTGSAVLPSRPFSIGWIGSPATTPHLRSVIDELAGFARGRDVELVAIGATPFAAGDLRIRWVDWSEETEVQALARTHVGIMPLPATPFARGKCGFKLIQGMACWRPVIGSPVGANCQIVDDGVTGLLAEDGQWAQALARLYDDRELCDRLGAAGRRRVEQDYSLAAWAPRVAGLWVRAANREFVPSAEPEARETDSQPCVE